MSLITEQARARVSHGKWIADCPRQYCNNAVALRPRQSSFHCGGPGGCQLVVSVEWPNNVDEIWDVLMERPVPATRNWFPSNHQLALSWGLPHGQSVQDLKDEAREHGVE